MVLQLRLPGGLQHTGAPRVIYDSVVKYNERLLCIVGEETQLRLAGAPGTGILQSPDMSPQRSRRPACQQSSGADTVTPGTPGGSTAGNMYDGIKTIG